SVYFCFFFQAEDGIRDRNVTGVQTCALPISGDARARDHTWLCLSDTELVALWVQHDNVVEGLFIVLFTHARGSESDQLRHFRPRSEERRVGKECRARWWSDDENDQKERRKMT